MKTLRISTVMLLGLFVTAGLILNFGGCSNDTALGPDEMSSGDSMQGLSKGKGNIEPGNTNYPQSAELQVHYNRDMKAWTGGNAVLPNGSRLHVTDYSFTPPGRGRKIKPKTITMEVDKVENGNSYDLIFTFGPSGAKFSPPAQMCFAWNDMETQETPKLYYIEDDGTWTELDPVSVDKGNKKVAANVSHFSRYALSISH